MEATQSAEVIEVSLEKTIETKLIQANVTTAVLAALKEKYGNMKLRALDDKESYLELKAAAKDCAKLRTETVKICKKGREDAVKEQKLWIAKEKEVVGEIATVEDPLDAEIAKFDAEVERLATEEKNRQEEAYIHRQASLTKMGAVFADGSFTLGDASFEANLIKGSSEEVWADAVLPKFQTEYEKIEAVRIAQEKEKEAAAAEMKRQQEELLRQQAELKAQQEEMQRQKAETERLALEKQRTEELEKERTNTALQKKRFELMYPVNPTGADMEMTSLWALSETDFAEMLAAKTVEFQKAKAEKERLAEEKRLADIEEAKQKAIQAEKERVAEQARLDEIKKKQAEEKRIAELDAANDKTKWEEFVKQVSVIGTFEMRSGQYRKKMQIAKEKLEEIKAL